MLRSLNSLRGCAIHASMGDMPEGDTSESAAREGNATGGAIGHIKDFYFCDKTWFVRYVVVATGGSRSGRTVLLSPAVLRQLDGESHTLAAGMTREQIATAPHSDTHRPVARQREMAIEAACAAYARLGYESLGLLRYPNYDTGRGVPDAVPPGGRKVAGRATPENNSTPFDALLDRGDDAQDPHLRSSNEVEGYRLAARHVGIGRIADFMVDIQGINRCIRYLVVDTRPWWAGRKVLVASSWVEWVSWDDKKVGVALERKVIQNAPEFDPTMPIDHRYEERLYDHYGPSSFR